MPDRALLPCLEPHCPGYRIDGSRYCPVHDAEREAFDTAPHARYPYATCNRNRHFRRLRAAWLMRHPLCITCGEPGAVLDHRIPHRGDLDLFWDQSNWQTLCTSCHNRKTAREVGRGVHDSGRGSHNSAASSRRPGGGDRGSSRAA